MSGCFNARDELKKWNPGSGEGPIKVIIGLRNKNAQKFSTMLVQGTRIVVHGSLESINEVQLFKDEVKTKVNGSHALLDVDRRDKGIVVPCPPPKMVLNKAEVVELERVCNIPGSDLTIVFTA